MNQIKSNEQLARGSKRKLLKFTWIPVLGSGLITTGIYALVNRVSYTYDVNMMDENSALISTLMADDVIEQDTNDAQYYNFIGSTRDAMKENIIKLLQTNAKYVLYVGRGSCGDCSDMREHVMPLTSDKTIPLFYVDGDAFRVDSKWQNEWYDLFGSYDMNIESPFLKGYKFTYTPALNLVVNGRLAESFWEFGGPGKDATTDKQKANSLYRSRYNRGGTVEQKEQGYKNAAWDIDRLFAKWKGY